MRLSRIEAMKRAAALRNELIGSRASLQIKDHLSRVNFLALKQSSDQYFSPLEGVQGLFCRRCNVAEELYYQSKYVYKFNERSTVNLNLK